MKRGFFLLLAIATLAQAQPDPEAARAQPAPEVASGWQDKKPVYARHHMVVAAHPLAVAAGLRMLARGGSAVDAAIAVQAVLNLVEPQSSGIGGGGFMLHWKNKAKRITSYDGREAAPLAATPERFLDEAGKPLPFREALASGLSVGVPGLLRMLESAHREHGRLPWRTLFAPAIRAAEKGFALSPRLHAALDGERDLFASPAARALYYQPDGRPKAVGTRIRNPELAATLRTIALHGAQAFYFGPIAEDMVAAVREHPRAGDLSLVDLARYRSIEREPVCGAYRGARVCGMGPPSSGGVAILQILGILGHLGFKDLPAGSAQALHQFSEAGRLAYADRGRYLADPDFSPQPVEGLLDPAYLAARARLVGERSMGRAAPGVPRQAAAFADAIETPLAGTSHISVVDREGNAVSMTTSIESAFGSRIQVRGFLLNNELTDFSFLPAVAGIPIANRVEPGKRPRSSMSPTLVFDRAGRLKMVIGSPGGASIVNFVAKTLVATLDWGFDIQSAIALPNFGSRNGPTEIEAGSLYELQIPGLRERGHEIRSVDQTSGLHGIERVRGGWRGGADPRREGIARGR